jgi:hypothetical protein
MRQFESDEIAIEDNGRVEIDDGQVRFKQAIDADDNVLHFCAP